MLAIRILQEQGAQVEALNFRTTFACCQETAALAARELGVRHTVLAQEDDYLDVIRRPKYGYGRGANPCVDCRIYMFRKAKDYVDEVGADCVISGEVLGQRPMSQKRRDLDLIAHDAGLEDRLLRPLSALRLPATRVEREGLVDRQRLYGFVGRSRKPLIALARQFGFRQIPSPSTGCALTEPQFATKVHDLVQLNPANQRWDFELLKYGRHIRFDRHTKVVVGRHETENRHLEYLFHESPSCDTALLIPEGFLGPSALLCGEPQRAALDFAASLLRRYGKPPYGDCAMALVHDKSGQFSIPAEPLAEPAEVQTL